MDSPSIRGLVPRRDHKPSSTQATPLRSSESTCTASDLAATNSSAQFLDGTLRSKTTDYSTQGSPPLRSKVMAADELPVFQILQTQDVQKDYDLELDHVTTWVDDLDLALHQDRKKKLVKIVSDVDALFAIDGASDQKQCPAKRSHSAENSKVRSNTTIPPKGALGKRRKYPSKSTTSQISKPESSDSDAPSDHSVCSDSSDPPGLSCPFVKHDRRRYRKVANSCTERFGFPTPGKLVEHLKRVHSLRVPCCIICKLRFSGRTRGHAERAQQLHVNLQQCHPRELTSKEPEWMSEEQDARFASSVILGQSFNAEEKWRSIYRQIFDLPADSPVPDPYYDYLIPSHEVSGVNDGVGQRHNASYVPTIHPFGQTNNMDTLTASSFNLPPEGDLSSSSWTRSDREHPEHAVSNALNPHRIPRTAQPQPSPAPTTFLTAQSLDINERSQPATPFEYGIYQGQDSGYQSLGQLSGLETAVPLDVSEHVRLQDTFSEVHTDLGILNADGMRHGSRLDLMGLELDTFQFPDSIDVRNDKR